MSNQVNYELKNYNNQNYIANTYLTFQVDTFIKNADYAAPNYQHKNYYTAFSVFGEAIKVNLQVQKTGSVSFTVGIEVEGAPRKTITVDTDIVNLFSKRIFVNLQAKKRESLSFNVDTITNNPNYNIRNYMSKNWNTGGIIPSKSFTASTTLLGVESKSFKVDIQTEEIEEFKKQFTANLQIQFSPEKTISADTRLVNLFDKTMKVDLQAREIFSDSFKADTQIEAIKNVQIKADTRLVNIFNKQITVNLQAREIFSKSIKVDLEAERTTTNETIKVDMIVIELRNESINVDIVLIRPLPFRMTGQILPAIQITGQILPAIQLSGQLQ